MNWLAAALKQSIALLFNIVISSVCFILDSVLFVIAKGSFIPHSREVILMDAVLGQTFI